MNSSDINPAVAFGNLNEHVQGLSNMDFGWKTAKNTLPPSPYLFSSHSAVDEPSAGLAVSPLGADFAVSMLNCAEYVGFFGA